MAEAGGGVPELEGVILAAGRGARMGELGRIVPKAALLVGDAPVVVHQLRLLRSLGVRRAHVVVGHLGEAVAECARRQPVAGLEVRFAEQTASLGSAHALNALRGRVNPPFFLLLGDYIFSAPGAPLLRERLLRGESAISVKPEPSDELLRAACAVETGEGGRVRGLVEKPLCPRGRLKGCGFYALQAEAMEAVAATPRTALRDEYELTTSLDLLARSDAPLFAEEVFDWDVNLTTPADLVAANGHWLAERGLAAHAAPSARLAPGVRLLRSVVGPGAEVAGRGVLADSVVLAGARLECGGGVPAPPSVVTPGGVFPCA